MKYIIANWKMNMDLDSLIKWLASFSQFKKTQPRGVEVVVAPSFIHIPVVFELSKKIPIKLASQDVSLEERGSHTGECGAFQIKDFCKYAIIGHSERKENKEIIIKKRDLCFKEGIIPIVCFVKPENLPDFYKKGCLIAWEDPNNISVNGVYRAQSADQIREIAKEIRKILPKEASLIYGGSVNEGNIAEIAKIDDLDGVLVGNASLDSKSFANIIKTYS